MLDHSSPIILSHPAILEDDLSLVFRIQPTASGNLISETYGPKGLFVDVNSSFGLHAGGGGSYNVAQTAPNILSDKAWHTVVATFGGKPARAITLYVDGKELASGKTPSLASNLNSRSFLASLAKFRKSASTIAS